MHLNYKRKRFCNSKFVVLLLTIILLSGCHSANPVTSSISETSITSLPVTISELTPAPKAEWSLNTLIDMELPDLDYASEDHLIFHGYFGLFVYDLKQKQLINSLNLEKIQCQNIQSDLPCKIEVSSDGALVWLYPSDKDYMYTFDIFNDILEQSEIELHHNIFNDLVATQDVLSSSLGNQIKRCSTNAVPFEDQSYGYLHVGYGSLSEMTYNRSNLSWNLFTQKDNPAPILLKQEDSFYKSYAKYAKESTQNFISAYFSLFNQRDYAGICSLSKNVTYSDEIQLLWKMQQKTLDTCEQSKLSSEKYACFQFTVITDNSQNEILYLYLVKEKDGWIADGSLHSELPPDDWWNGVYYDWNQMNGEE